MSAGRGQAGVIAASAAVLMLLASPLGRDALEARLVTHMLVQLPLLVLVGLGFGHATSAIVRAARARWNRGGATGLVLAFVIGMFWMLPRAMDSALVDMRFEIGKFVSLPLAGLALAWSYQQAGVIVKGVLTAHVVSALGVMGWAYLAAPVRLCNSYLASDQQAAGAGLLGLGVALSVYFSVRLLCGPLRASPSAGARDPATVLIAAK